MRRVTLVIALMVSPPCRDVGAAHGRPSVDPLQLIRVEDITAVCRVHQPTVPFEGVLDLESLAAYNEDVSFFQIVHRREIPHPTLACFVFGHLYHSSQVD